MYQAAENRYETMEYKRCGRSGLKLPRVALGLWQNFGLEKTITDQEEILCPAFDHWDHTLRSREQLRSSVKRACGEKFRTGIKGLPWYIPG